MVRAQVSWRQVTFPERNHGGPHPASSLGQGGGPRPSRHPHTHTHLWEQSEAPSSWESLGSIQGSRLGWVQGLGVQGAGVGPVEARLGLFPPSSAAEVIFFPSAAAEFLFELDK